MYVHVAALVGQLVECQIRIMDQICRIQFHPRQLSVIIYNSPFWFGCVHMLALFLSHIHDLCIIQS